MNRHVRFHDSEYSGSTGYHYQGILDEVALYPTALISTQIQGHYAEGAGQTLEVRVLSPTPRKR